MLHDLQLVDQRETLMEESLVQKMINCLVLCHKKSNVEACVHKNERWEVTKYISVWNIQSLSFKFK